MTTPLDPKDPKRPLNDIDANRVDVDPKHVDTKHVDTTHVADKTRTTTVTETRRVADPVNGAHTVGEKKKFPWWILIPIILLLGLLTWLLWPKHNAEPVATATVHTTAVTTVASPATTAPTTTTSTSTSTSTSTATTTTTQVSTSTATSTTTSTATVTKTP